MAQIAVDGDYIIVQCDFRQKNIPKSIGGKWDKINKVWYMPLTIYNVNYLCDKFNVDISNSFQDDIEQQRAKENRLDVIKNAYDKNLSVGLKISGMKQSLYSFQKLGVAFALENNDGVLIGDHMGLGKTIQAIATACYKKHKDKTSECLVITPASLKWNWPLEIEKFTNEKYVVIDGSSKNRVDQWLGKYVCRQNDRGNVEYVESKQKPFFYVVNFALVVEDLFGGKKYTIKKDDTEEQIERKIKIMEKAQDRAKQLKEARSKNWGCVIIDEIHMLKSHKARRTQEIKKLKSQFRIGLSGTPLDGRLEELHSVMDFVKPGLFESKYNFLLKHATFDFWGKITGYKDIATVRQRIKPFFIRRLKEDVLKELPDKIYENRYVVLSNQEKKIYKQLANREHDLTKNEEAIVAAIRCKQFCDFPELAGVSKIKQNSKMQEFLDVVHEIVIVNGQKVLIFSQYAQMNEIIKKELDKMGIKYYYIWSKTDKKERATIQEKFNNDDSLDAIIGTDAMSMGLNLTAATYVINYDDAWSPSTMSQREDRTHRIKQKNVVTVVNFVCKDTIEERIRSVLYGKSSLSSKVLGDDTDEVVLRRLGNKEVEKLL